MPGSYMTDFTFLLTDLEDSTVLWERFPEGMQQAVCEHDTLLRQAIESQGGSVFKTGGDAFYATFANPINGLLAALQAQAALQKMEWTDAKTGETFHLKFRAAVCFGAAESRDGDYFGPGINRAARLLSAAHGDQTLIAASVEAIVREHLPPDTELRSLGKHRLKSLPLPEEIFQLMHPTLSAEMPPLRVLASFTHNLPVSLSHFVGREAELAEIKRLLTTMRLLTICGPGGTGKTRLALQAAQSLTEGYRHGVWFIELAPFAQEMLVEQGVARALGIRPAPDQPIRQALLDNLQSMSLLLILDNCEHLLRACATFAQAILQNCPNVQIIATSQEPLHAEGETVFPLLPLSLPKIIDRLAPEDLMQWEATRLFVERAQAVLPSFSPSAKSAPAIMRLCQRLDGIPLALELAAAQIRSFSVEKILTLLDARFRLAMRGTETVSPRHQTLQNMVEWSCGLLTQAERQLLYRLSVFAGGWSLAAAEEVAADDETIARSAECPPISRAEIALLLANLLQKSLVVRETSDLSERYRMLETVRGYSLTALDAGSMGTTTRRRHFGWFLAQAEEASGLLIGALQEETLQSLERELDNFRAALIWCSQEKTQAEAGLRLATELRWFWEIRGYPGEARTYLKTLLEQTQDAVFPERTDALLVAGIFACQQCDYITARKLLEESQKLFTVQENRKGQADVLGGLGDTAYGMGDYNRARTLHLQSLEWRRKTEDAHGILTSLTSLGNIAWFQQDLETAQRCYEEALQLAIALDSKRDVAFLLSNLGMINSADDILQARPFFEQSLALQEELGDYYGMASSLTNLAENLRDEGQNSAARDAYLKALRLFGDLGQSRHIAHVLAGLAAVANATGNYTHSVRLVGMAEGMLQKLGIAAPEYQSELKTAQQILGLAVFTVEKMKGRTQSLEDMIAFVEEMPLT